MEYSAAMIGSFIAGAINTLAGNGSVITLSILTDLIGLPGNIANGTNRVGVLLQAAGSSSGFAKNNVTDLSKSKLIIALTISGAIIGVYCATIVSNEQFMFVFKYLMIIMLLVIMVKPERWLQTSDVKALPFWVSIPVFLALGFYGGFIQMGMGIFFLAVLVLISRYSIMEANAIKTIIILIYTVIVLAIFAYKGLVNWEAGIIMAIGQTLGGYLTAAYASQRSDIHIWAYRLLIAIIIFAICTQFGLIKLF
ncbi:MAG: sulfite exporter TauE/SafE family protein [Saprospiraceae bacterium]|nr:sulfite exporter TauE/SafE family protein [Saprospiraceae bacterium]